MRNAIRTLAVGAALLFGAGACANLDVVNPNNADAARALATPGDVESLIAGSYNTWFSGTYSSNGPGSFLSVQSFQHTAPWANFGMEYYGRLPRQPIVNDVADSFYGYFTRPWYYSYRAIAAISDGLRSMEDPDIASTLGAANVLRDQAYSYFVMGMAHATLAVVYDQAFIIDETTDLTQPQEAVSYNDVMAAAMGYFDKAISLCGQGSFTLPNSWMSADVSNTDLAKIAHSEKARYRAAVARNPTERKAVDWNAVMTDAAAGVTSDFAPLIDYDSGWFIGPIYYARSGWGEVPYWVYGMADQSGNFQTWLAQAIPDKTPNPTTGPILIVTPDLRLPQGSTIEDQQANPGRYVYNPKDIAGVWARPDRGTWRWSYYRVDRYLDYIHTLSDYVPEVPAVEMDLLRAEGLYYKGDMAGAAAIINQTRTAAGLNATDAGGTNTSCVPKLPDGSCGSLWEMLKWEKRMEIQFQGLFAAPWYFDSRGWGDLWKDTPLQFPVPCNELQVLQILPCYAFGGSGGEMGAPTSTYHYNGEG